VVSNLLTNAREAVGPAGEIELQAHVSPEGNPRRPALKLTVRDTGRGMSEDFIRTSLFRPFSSTKATGLGIGLAQCKAIVQAHGGTIAVESRPGQYTVFTVSLPVDPVIPAVVRGTA